MTAQPDELPERSRPSQTVGGFLAAAAMFAGVVALFYYPGRIGPAAIVIALVAAGLCEARRFAGLAMAVAGLGWFFGTLIAIFLDRPLF